MRFADENKQSSDVHNLMFVALLQTPRRELWHNAQPKEMTVCVIDYVCVDVVFVGFIGVSVIANNFLVTFWLEW